MAKVAALLRKSLPNVTCNTGCKVESIGADSVTYSRDGKQESVPADLVLMAIGRSPNTKGLNLEGIGLDFDPRRGIRVDEQLRSGNLNLAELDLQHVDRNAELTENVIRKLRAGMMPPAGMPRPDAAAITALVASLESAIESGETPSTLACTRSESRSSLGCRRRSSARSAR